MQIDSVIDDVREFHQKMRAPIARPPRLLPGNATMAGAIAVRLQVFADETAQTVAATNDVLLARAAMAIEELAEWLTAHERSDLIAADSPTSSRTRLWDQRRQIFRRVSVIEIFQEARPRNNKRPGSEDIPAS